MGLLIVFQVLILPLHLSFQIVVAYAAEQDNARLPILKDHNLKAEVVVEGLDHPTQMAFLGPDDFLVLEKNSGKVIRVINGKALSHPLIDLSVANQNERGLLGLAISKNLNSNNHNGKGQFDNLTKIYLFYTESEKDGNDKCPLKSYCEVGNDPEGNRLYRFSLSNNSLVNPKVLLDLPAWPGSDHMGGVIKIGPDENLYLTGGDGDSCANRIHCQEEDFEDSVLKSETSNIPNGEPPTGRGGILRITQNGDAVKDGIIGDYAPLNWYFAYGIRNSYGMDFDPISGKLWDTENGAGFGDEINVVEPGFNSGWLKIQGIWPVTNLDPNTKNRGYTSDDFKDNSEFHHHGLVDFNGKGAYSKPEFVWNVPVGVTALLFLRSDKLGKEYENDLFAGDIDHGSIYHFELNKNRTALDLRGKLSDSIANDGEESKDLIFGKGFGGITDMDVGPDGYLYVLSYLQETVYRISPISN